MYAFTRNTQFSTNRTLFLQRPRKPISLSAIMFHFSTVASLGEFPVLSLNVLSPQTSRASAWHVRVPFALVAAITRRRWNTCGNLKKHGTRAPVNFCKKLLSGLCITSGELCAIRAFGREGGVVTILNALSSRDLVFGLSFLLFVHPPIRMTLHPKGYCVSLQERSRSSSSLALPVSILSIEHDQKTSVKRHTVLPWQARNEM